MGLLRYLNKKPALRAGFNLKKWVYSFFICFSVTHLVPKTDLSYLMWYLFSPTSITVAGSGTIPYSTSTLSPTLNFVSGAAGGGGGGRHPGARRPTARRPHPRAGPRAVHRPPGRAAAHLAASSGTGQQRFGPQTHHSSGKREGSAAGRAVHGGDSDGE